jgi:integrase
MLNDVEAYIALRRAAGFEMKNAEFLLKSFARFAVERKETHVNTQTSIDWAALGPSTAQRDARLKAVCRFARYIRIEDDRHQAPPANHFGARKKRRPPHIYSTDDINRLIGTALQLCPKNGLKSQTYATLIALLAATGLRISEALNLNVADITKDGLLIRETKFRKTRLTPLHDTTAAGLERYLRQRQPRSSDDLVFIGNHGGPLRYTTVRDTFNRMVEKVGIRPASGGRRPRLHDLRHTFAVRALQACPAGRSRTGKHIPGDVHGPRQHLRDLLVS